MPRPGITLPTVDNLADLGRVAVAGSCFARDPRGSGRYIYNIEPTATPTGVAACTLWRYDTQSKSKQAMPAPTMGANTVVGAGTCLLFDASRGTNGAGFLWFLTPENATAAGIEWARFQYLDLGNLAGGWTARTVVGLGLAAQLPEAAMTHTCSAIIASGNDDYIYLVIVGLAAIYRYGIAGNAWAVRPMAGGVRAAVAATGTTAMFSRAQPDRIYSLRGGGSAVMDYYIISTDAMNNVLALIPATETWTAGTECAHLSGYGTQGLNVYAQSGRVKHIDLTTGDVVPLGDIGQTDGTAHLGNGIAPYMVGPEVYIAIRPHTTAEVKRIHVVY